MLPNFYLQHEHEVRLDEHDRVLHRFIPDLDISSVNNILKKEYIYPHNKEFCIMLTHDVDYIYFNTKKRIRYAMNAISNKKWSHIKNIFRTRCSVDNPLLNTKKILDLENKYNATSTFFIMAATDKDMRYHVADTRALLHILQKQNREVGLHGSYTSYTNGEQLKKEKVMLEDVLGREVIGIRQHYLRFNRKTWQAQAEAGFQYDATLGYADHVGFRNGAAYPFYAFDEMNQILPMIAIPLVIMEGTVDAHKYMNISFEQQMEDAWAACKLVLDKIKQARGCVSILWHPDQFDDVLHPNSIDLYERILKYGAENNAWMTSGEQVMKHLQKHSET